MDGFKIDQRGTYFTFQRFLEKIDCADALAASEKNAIYKDIIEHFPVCLDLMLGYICPEVAVLDADKFPISFSDKVKEFVSFFNDQNFYIYLDTFPKKHLLAVDAVTLVKILSFDTFGFDFFVCDSGLTSFLMETNEGIILSSGKFTEFFSDLRRG